MHVDESLNYHNQKARLQWLIESIGLSLWVISCLYSDKSLIHLFYTEGLFAVNGFNIIDTTATSQKAATFNNSQSLNLLSCMIDSE